MSTVLGRRPRDPAPGLRRGRLPRASWIVAAAVLAPALAPFLMLFGRALGGGAEALQTVLSTRTLRLTANTIALIAAVTAAASVIGIAAAWLTERTDVPGRRLWRVLVALPLVIPSYVIALALLSAWGPSGLIAEATGFGMPALGGFPGAWLALTIATYPFVYLVAAAALRRLDPALDDAARGLGASPRRVFRTIVLPQLRPAVGAGALLVALYTLSDFGAVSLMRFDAFTRLVYAQYAGRLDRTPAAVLAVLLVVLALAVLWVEQRSRGRSAYHGRAVARPAPPLQLSTVQRRIALLALGGLVLVSLAGPLLTLAGWVLRGGSRVPATLDWGAAAGSLTGSALAAVVAMAAALPVAGLVVRHRRGPWVERAAYVVFSLPHIAVALGMVLLASRYLGGLYQSLTLLVLVYASIFFAQALGPARAALLQVDPSIEEASRSLGRNRTATMLRITLPLVRGGVLAGGLLVFLTTMKELPATLLLRPTGFDTLAVGIWSAADELLYGRAAAWALLLVAVSAVPMYVLTTRNAR